MYFNVLVLFVARNKYDKFFMSLLFSVIAYNRFAS